MAAARGGAKQEGETSFGGTAPGQRGSIHIRTSEVGSTPGAPGRPSVLFLDSCDTAGVVKTWALWVDSTGDLRIVEAGPPTNNPAGPDDIATVIADEDGSGAVVGGQS